MDFLKKFANKTKIKYGAVLAGFLAIIIAIIVLLNVIVSILADRYNWYFDMTDEDLYSVSDTFVETMDKIDESINIEIVFLDDEATVENDFTSVGVVGRSYINMTATQLANRLPNISVSYHSTDDISFLRQFDLSTKSGVEFNEENIIIMRTTAPGVVDGTHFEVYNPSDFYVSDSNYSLFAYNGEAKIIEAAIRLTSDGDPTVYFVSNHGELTTIDTLAKLFENAGFSYDVISLTEKRYTCECGTEYTESYLEAWDKANNYTDEESDVETDENGNQIFVKNFKCPAKSCDAGQYDVLVKDMKVLEKIPENARAVIIYEPQTDFTKEEIVLLEEYLNIKGTVMTFLDASIDKDEMAELYGWLETWGGITINTEGSGYVTDAMHAIGSTDTKFEAQIPSNDATDAFFPGFSGSKDTFVVTNSVTIDIKADRIEGDNDSYQTLPLLTTESSAIFNEKDKEHVLMSLSKHGILVENPEATNVAQDSFSSCLLVCASGSFVNDNHLVATTNSNQDFVRHLVAATTRSQIYSTNVEFKVFNNYDLTITSNQQTTVLVISMTVLPAISLIVGFVVIYRRKRR